MGFNRLYLIKKLLSINKNKINILKDKVDLAIKANGGKEFKHNWCQCDPSTGSVPCEYCAIYDALKVVNIFLNSIT